MSLIAWSVLRSDTNLACGTGDKVDGQGGVIKIERRRNVWGIYSLFWSFPFFLLIVWRFSFENAVDENRDWTLKM